MIVAGSIAACALAVAADASLRFVERRTAVSRPLRVRSKRSKFKRVYE
jgi:hypothetical protein